MDYHYSDTPKVCYRLFKIDSDTQHVFITKYMNINI